jgi:hypothetical protein
VVGADEFDDVIGGQEWGQAFLPVIVATLNFAFGLGCGKEFATAMKSDCRIAVLAAYGFSAKKDLLAQFIALNQEVAAKIEKGEPVTAPGVPPNYPDAKKLVTEDCIRPQLTIYPPYEPPNPTPLRKPIPEQAEADAAHFYSAKEEGPPYRTKK